MYLLMQQVLNFHRKMGQPIGDPRDPDITVEQDFRLALIEEEYRELQLALMGYKKGPNGALVPCDNKTDQIAHVADALGDMFYVIAGSAAAWGIEMGPVLDEIHASNMSKTPNPKGKTIKGRGFKPADIERVLAECAQEFTKNPEDYFGDTEDAYWPTPRKERVGNMQPELEQVRKETLSIPVDLPLKAKEKCPSNECQIRGKCTGHIWCTGENK